MTQAMKVAEMATWREVLMGRTMEVDEGVLATQVAMAGSTVATMGLAMREAPQADRLAGVLVEPREVRRVAEEVARAMGASAA